MKTWYNIEQKLEDISQWVLDYFTWPSTLTQVKVLAAQENSTKIPNLVSGKPDFVDKVYILALEGKTQDSTITTFSLPMITIKGKTGGYFYTAFIKTTGSSTESGFYPFIQP